MDNAIDESPETVTNNSQKEKVHDDKKAIVELNNDLPSTFAVRIPVQESLKEFIFKYVHTRNETGNGKDSTKIDKELNKW